MALEQCQVSFILCGELVKHNFSDIAKVATRPHDIMAELCHSYSGYLSYKKAWRSKEALLKSLIGSDEESYAMLHSSLMCWRIVALVHLFPLRQRMTIDFSEFYFVWMLLFKVGHIVGQC